MSHVVKMNMVFKDLEALELAAAALGMVLDRGAYVGTELPQSQWLKWKWYGRWMADYSKGDAAYLNGIDTKLYGRAPMVIRNPNVRGSYEIGVYPRDHYFVTGDDRTQTRVEGLNYALVMDYYNGGRGLVKTVAGARNAADYAARGDNSTGDGKNCNKLTTAYAIEVARKNPAMKGRRFEVEKLEDGRTVIKAQSVAVRS